MLTQQSRLSRNPQLQDRGQHRSGTAYPAETWTGGSRTRTVCGDHTLDLCSADEAYRTRSIEELQRVVGISRDLRHRFHCPNPVLLVTNVGGFSEHHHPTKITLRQRLIDSLQKSILEGGKFPDHATFPTTGGQRYHNLFVDSAFIREFCEDTGMRVYGCFTLQAGLHA